jgi:signal recognition particle GTPase
MSFTESKNRYVQDLEYFLGTNKERIPADLFEELVDIFGDIDYAVSVMEDIINDIHHTVMKVKKDGLLC